MQHYVFISNVQKAKPGEVEETYNMLDPRARLGYALHSTECRGADFVKALRAKGVLEKERVMVRRTIAGAAEGIFYGVVKFRS